MCRYIVLVSGFCMRWLWALLMGFVWVLWHCCRLNGRNYCNSSTKAFSCRYNFFDFEFLCILFNSLALSNYCYIGTSKTSFSNSERECFRRFWFSLYEGQVFAVVCFGKWYFSPSDLYRIHKYLPHHSYL